MEKEKEENKRKMEELVILMGGRFVTTARGREGFTTRFSQVKGGNSVEKTSRNKKIVKPRKRKNAQT